MNYYHKTKPKSVKSGLLIITLLVIVLIVVGLLFTFVRPAAGTAAITHGGQSEEVLSAEPIMNAGAAQSEWVPELPMRLIIPAIDVDAAIQYVGLATDGSGEMAVPDNFTDVGWYQDGVRPGMRGSAVMAGHYNGKNLPEAVFYDLDTLKVGDEVIVMSAERLEDIFVVVKVETYDYDADTTEIFRSTDNKNRLNLITCGGRWLPGENQYNQRTVVFTELLTDVE